MIMSKPILVLLAGCASLSSIAMASDGKAAEDAMRDHVAYLASDELRGRQPGTEGYAKAAAYTARKMAEAGLKPAGDRGSWYQKVPLVATRSTGAPAMTVDGQPLSFKGDFAVWPTPGLQGVELDAPVIFAGYGVVDPVTGRDDYRGLDVRGKIVALFINGPKGVDSEIAAHMGWPFDRTKLAKARGAVGVVLLHTRQWDQLLPFDFIVPIFAGEQTSWGDAKGMPDLGTPRIGVLSVAGATKLFAKSGISWEDVRNAEHAGQPVRLGPLGVRMTTKQAYETTRIESPNVVGRLKGSDPKLAAETVVVTAHLDHVGTIAPVKGDEIANGALDNAVGVAVILEMAKSFQANRDKPKRSILFVALTAEESGLTGSDYFVHHPPVPAAKIVANVNVDNPILTYRFEDMIVYGGERSGIGPIARAVIDGAGYTVSPDPAPEQAVFTRSDHYSFVRIGVPAVFVYPGQKGPGREATKDAFLHRYHTPIDDMTVPFDWSAGREFVKINYLITRGIADAPDRPRWVKGDYFGGLYGAAAGR